MQVLNSSQQIELRKDNKLLNLLNRHFRFLTALAETPSNEFHRKEVHTTIGSQRSFVVLNGCFFYLRVKFFIHFLLKQLIKITIAKSKCEVLCTHTHTHEITLVFVIQY